MEIAVYRKLVECEEDRLGITASEFFLQQSGGRKTYSTYTRTRMRTGGGTLLRDNCQLIGMPLIVLARQAQKIAINRIYSELLGRHKSCLRAASISVLKRVFELSLSGDSVTMHMFLKDNLEL